MTNIPAKSELKEESKQAYFWDCYSREMAITDESALALFLQTANTMPAWFTGLMSIRNKVVSKLGLKDLGQIGDLDVSKQVQDYKIGDRVGIFHLISNSHDEVVLEDRDKHLSVKVSIFIERVEGKSKVYTSSLVHVNNRFGKVYMFIITPVHKVIVPLMLNKLSKRYA
ncbi:DUF2867 domain-containing protein [Marinomonas sp. C2222]|uniref:DUF2867 domain-containing protein n=1 Tax=Marinomonas sargassi TaxID=2984494 RepID=A0ABT2YUF5_9GAMM|nr:DUF2867 domain-containing protein [Marinomonas sargassi]MCV2403244.1 DUF2867 domain-containing protein [Marinomonas sargassi]